MPFLVPHSKKETKPTEQKVLKQNVNCFHCNNAIETGKEIYLKNEKDEVKIFCCNGCRTISSWISHSKLDKFYDYRGSLKLEVDNEIANPVSIDNQSLYDEYVNDLGNGKKEVFININNLSCSACVWLIEKTIQNLDGVNFARLNFTSSRLQVSWDDQKIQLSDIVNQIRMIGYLPTLCSSLSQNSGLKIRLKDLLYRIIISLFCLANIMGFSFMLYYGYIFGMDPTYRQAFHIISMVLATPVYLYSLFPFFKNGIQNLLNKTLSMDLLIFVGISLAYFYSIIHTISNQGEVYFDSVCMIISIVLVGRYLETFYQYKVENRIFHFLQDLPKQYNVLLKKNQYQTKKINEIQKNDLVQILKGDRIPFDSILHSKIGYFDESFLTGEAEPIRKKKGEQILSGSLALDRSVIIVTSPSNQSNLFKIRKLVEELLNSKPKFQKLIDQLSNYFVGIVFCISILTCVIWLYIGLDFSNALINAIGVLIIACPCALGIAYPTAVAMGYLLSLKNKILIKNSTTLEKLANINSLVLDKTGTLTIGKPKIVKEELDYAELVRPLVLLIERNSNHPISNAFKQYYKYIDETILDSFEIVKLKEIPGFGLEAKISKKNNQYKIKIGKEKFVKASHFDNKADVYISINNQVYGSWKIQDEIRSTSLIAVKILKQKIHSIFILSGDKKTNVEKIANQFGKIKYESDLTPEEKLKKIEGLQKENKSVMMVGDGINDSMGIAKSDIGVSMGMGADLSISHADVILMNNDLMGIVHAMEIGKLTKATIIRNICLSAFYNALLIPVAALGYLSPILCAVMMSISSLTVIANSVLMLWRKRS